MEELLKNSHVKIFFNILYNTVTGNIFLLEKNVWFNSIHHYNSIACDKFQRKTHSVIQTEPIKKLSGMGEGISFHAVYTDYLNQNWQ